MKAVFEKSETVFEENSMENLFYSMGNDHPGAMTLHNYPNFLRNIKLPDSSPHGSGHVDLATIDILRDRERGVPRLAFKHNIYENLISYNKLFVDTRIKKFWKTGAC